MDTSHVRVALVGYGFAGRTFHAPSISAVAGLELVVFGSSKQEELLAKFPGATVVPAADAAVHADVDLVVIATPNTSHFSLASAALRAGKHVVIDKPFTVTLAEAESLAALAAEQGRLLTVFHNRRWDSEVLAAKAVLESGALGRVAHFEMHQDRFRPVVRQRWREDAGPGAGLWFDLAPHMIDLALFLFGMPHAVSADLAMLRDGGQTDDWGHAVLHYPGMRAVLHASLLVAGGVPRLALHGTQGSWIKTGADVQERQLMAGMMPSDPAFGIDPDPGVFYDGAKGTATPMPVPQGCQQKFYEGVRDSILHGTPLPVSTEEALNTMRVLMATYDSARTGTVQPLRD